ncbi:MAG TPA: hypothetical protein VGN63_19765 [Flavisolibacter sp.]|jgi:hypothetical protein|nr:hypothetical protein [Flavisolibacter sp.]
MSHQALPLISDVTKLPDEQSHPFREGIERLHSYILLASSRLTEDIKWNDPNYSIDNNENSSTQRGATDFSLWCQGEGAV